VIDIQSYKAQKQGIELLVEYDNLTDKKEDTLEQFSSWVVADMQRIQ